MCFLLFYLRCCCFLNSYTGLLIIQKIISWFVHLILISFIHLLFLFFPLGNRLSNFKWKVSNILILQNHTKIETLQLYLDLILINLNEQAYSLIFEIFSFLWLMNFLWKPLQYDNLVLPFLPISVIYKFNISIFCLICHSFSKNCIIHYLEKSFSKLSLAFCPSLLSIWIYSFF